MKFKALGLVSGVSDIFVGHPSANLLQTGKPYFGLFLELKRIKGGVISQAQREFMSRANASGYLAVVANGANEAIQIINNYLNESVNEK